MHRPANTARFFEAHEFMSRLEKLPELRNALSLLSLHAHAASGTDRALSLVMLDETKKPNTENGELPVISAGEFRTAVLESKQPVLVAFCTSWSRPCQVLEAELHALSGTFAGRGKVVKVNADDSLDLSLWYDIQSVPTLLCFVEGEPRLRIVGTATRDAILAKVNPLLPATPSNESRMGI